MNSKLIVSLILLLALGLRVFSLDKNPPSLFGDEVDVGYQAYSILETGKDLSGRFLPLYFQSLSEYRTPLYIYSAVPFVAIFGLNEWGIRLPALFWGMVSIFGMYLLSRKLFNEKVALAAAFLISISPWHLQYSRASFEVTMLLSFVIFGIYFFIIGLKKYKYLLISTVLFGLSIYIYSTALVFSPLCLIILAIAYRKEFDEVNLKRIILAIILLAVVVMPAIWSIYTGEAKERFSSVSIFRDLVLLDKVNLARKSQTFYTPTGEIINNSTIVEGIFHNRPLIYLQVFSVNYMKAVSFNFLFAEGDINFRHNVHEMGELYYFEIILLIAGILYAATKLDRKMKILLFGLLLISPIPASLTSDGGYHATRLILMVPPLVIFNALGLVSLWELRKRYVGKILIYSICILFVINFVFYLHRYHVHYPVESWRWWHLGYKEAMTYMKDVEGNYAKVVFNNTYEPSLIRFLVWFNFKPAEFQAHYAETLKIGEVLPRFQGFKFQDKYYFGKADKVSEFVSSDMIYLVSARDEVEGDWDWSKSPPGNIKVLKTIRDPLGVPIFYVITAQ